MIAPQCRKKIGYARPEFRFKPTLRLHPEQRIVVRAIAMPAGKKPGTDLAAEILGLRSQRSFVRTRSEGDLLYARK